MALLSLNILVSARLVEFEPDGEQCCRCLDAAFLRAGILEVKVNENPYRQQSDCVLCGSCFDSIREAFNAAHE